jgi:hypothetical protein
VLDVSAAIRHLDTISKMAEREWKIGSPRTPSARKDFLRLTRSSGWPSRSGA